MFYFLKYNIVRHLHKIILGLLQLLSGSINQTSSVKKSKSRMTTKIQRLILAWKKGSNASSARPFNLLSLAKVTSVELESLSSSWEGSSVGYLPPKKEMRKSSWLWWRCNNIGRAARRNLHLQILFRVLVVQRKKGLWISTSI